MPGPLGTVMRVGLARNVLPSSTGDVILAAHGDPDFATVGRKNASCGERPT